MRLSYVAVPPLALAALALAGCRAPLWPAATAGAPDSAPPPGDAVAEAARVVPSDRATWPDDEDFEQNRGAIPRPFTVALARDAQGPPLLTLARRTAEGWQLASVVGQDALPRGCARTPCAWPASLVPEEPLVEPAPLPAALREAVVYARTLLAFEGPLDIEDETEDGAFFASLPPEVHSEPFAADVDLSPHLERLRRSHPHGRCSMDSGPQTVALLRARAAAQAGRTGWAVQGWISTVGYWSSPRMAWSSYGQSHPSGHLALLEEVGVEPDRLLLGLLAALPDEPSRLYLQDLRRVAPDLGPAFAAQARSLAADARVDALNRALLYATVAELPLNTADPLYTSLPAASRALLDLWTR